MPRCTAFALALACLILAGCGKGKKQPAILGEEQLAAFLVEVYVAEGKLNSIRLNRDSAVKLFEPFEGALMEKNKISDSVLKATYRYYIDHPAEFEKVYETVMDTLSLREERAQAASRNQLKNTAIPAKPGARQKPPSAGSPIGMPKLPIVKPK